MVNVKQIPVTRLEIDKLYCSEPAGLTPPHGEGDVTPLKISLSSHGRLCASSCPTAGSRLKDDARERPVSYSRVRLGEGFESLD